MRAKALLFISILFLLPGAALGAEQFMSEEASVERVLSWMEQRMAVMPGVAAWKWENKAAVVDATREQQVAEQAAARAKALGLAEEPVRKLFELQILLAREVQVQLHERWRKTGYDFGRPAPDLAKEVRPKLDEITTELLRAVYLAAPVFEQPDFATRFAPLAAQRLQGEGWNESARQQALQVLSAIRRVDRPALERISAARVLRIGTTGDYAPFTLETADGLSGADIDLALSLARELSAEPVFVRTTWSTLMSDLEAGRFDLAIGGISVTPAREAKASFSKPYTTGGKTLITRCREAQRLRDLPAVNRRGVRVIVNPGGTNEQFVREHIRQAEVRVHPDNRTIFEEIRAGRADVMITDDVEVELQIRRHPELCRPYRGTLTRADKAILMPRDPDLVAAVNNWLAGEIGAGTPARLIERHLQP